MVTVMEQLDIVSLFLLGLFGTGHCVGMCGPLVFALPGQTGRFVSHLVYHSGRLGIYALIGLLMGGLGAGLARLFSGAESTFYLKILAQIQVTFSLLSEIITNLHMIRNPKYHEDLIFLDSHLDLIWNKFWYYHTTTGPSQSVGGVFTRKGRR